MLFYEMLYHNYYTALCPDLPLLSNGMISYSLSALSKVEGTTATHNCDAGYVPSNGTVRVCQPDKTWNGSDIFCERKFCRLNEISYFYLMYIYSYQMWFSSLDSQWNCSNVI